MQRSRANSAASTSVLRQTTCETGAYSNAIESEHIVRCGPDLNLREVNEIRAALENRYPTGCPGAEFLLKLFPLSVGAWILLIRSGNREEVDTLGCEPADLEIDNVLRSVDTLVERLRANRIGNGGPQIRDQAD